MAHDALRSRGYLAGSDDERFAQLRSAFTDEGIRAVLCTRGGYGSQRIADRLLHDGPAIRSLVERGASFVGFSDLTELHRVLNRAGLITFYGPPLAWDRRNGPIAEESLRRALFATGDRVLESDPANPTAVLSRGTQFSGRTTGGNLSMLSSSLATSTQLVAANNVVVIEDCNETPLKIDRILTQLIRSCALTGVGAFVVGQFNGCEDRKYGADVVETLRERLALLARLEGREIPVLGGLQVGHGEEQLTMPLGADVTIDPSAGRLTFTRPTGGQ